MYGLIWLTAQAVNSGKVDRRNTMRSMAFGSARSEPRQSSLSFCSDHDERDQFQQTTRSNLRVIDPLETTL
jgi:hypothetical protein